MHCWFNRFAQQMTWIRVVIFRWTLIDYSLQVRVFSRFLLVMFRYLRECCCFFHGVFDVSSCCKSPVPTTACVFFPKSLSKHCPSFEFEDRPNYELPKFFYKTVLDFAKTKNPTFQRPGRERLIFKRCTSCE